MKFPPYFKICEIYIALLKVAKKVVPFHFVTTIEDFHFVSARNVENFHTNTKINYLWQTPSVALLL